MLYQNWLTVADVENLLRLAGFQTDPPLAGGAAAAADPAARAALQPLPGRASGRSSTSPSTNFLVARPAPAPARPTEPVVSVIVPARNEEGNIPAIFARTPEMGGGTELIFVEGHSKDDTWAAIEREIAAHPERRARAFQQTGKGKGDAVRLGFAEATGDVLMILDADLTVPPEDLPRFYEVLRSGQGEFVNGVRLVYPMEKEAMRFANLLGNKFFSLAFSWLLGQPIKDTLCGTKVLREPTTRRLAANRAYFGDFDPFGDFDLLFGAAKLSLKIVELPIRYRERTYGDDQHPALAPRLAAAQDVRLRRRPDQVHLIERPAMEPLKRWLEHPLTRGLDIDDPRTTHLRRRILRRASPSCAGSTRSGTGRSPPPCRAGPAPCWSSAPAPASSPTSSPGWCAPRSSTPPGSTLVLDGLALPFAAGSLRGIAMTNVLHHLPRPLRFFAEAARCVRPGGVVTMIEPWVTPWSRWVYTRLHHEPFLPEAPGVGDPGRRPALRSQRRAALDPLPARPRAASSARRRSGGCARSSRSCPSATWSPAGSRCAA